MEIEAMVPSVPTEELDLIARIRVIRGRRVLFDSDLAALYGVTTKRINEAAKRNHQRFPEDFAFRLNSLEAAALRSQIATSNPGRGGRRHTPIVFTEHGALMAASVLNSPRAVQMSVYVVRAFLRMREMLSSTPALAGKLAEIERSLANLDRETRTRFEDVYLAIRALKASPGHTTRQIGFTAPET